MSFLLVVYLFLANGDVKIERYPHAATTMTECLQLAQERREALWIKNNKNGTTSAMCVLEGNR
jgi:hypothetical protein